MDTWIECAWYKCRKRFEPRRRANQFYCADGPSHDGALYCSPACRQKSYRLRRRKDYSATVTPNPEGDTKVHGTVTHPKQNIEITGEFSAKNDHPGRLLRTRKGKIVPDAKWPGMYRIRWRDGRLSDMVNLTRAKDALQP